jgi:hypothetical protein
MINESTDPVEEKESLLSRWRSSVFPIHPADKASTRLLKHSAFYLFMVMLALISGAITLAIAFVL